MLHLERGAAAIRASPETIEVRAEIRRLETARRKVCTQQAFQILQEVGTRTV
jgi:hypothetical protein